MFSDNSKYAVLFGFIAVMALMIAVVFVGYQQMNENNRGMETIVNKYNAKTGYVITMYVAARERTISLLRMLNMEDPFDRDDEYLYYNELATHFAVARIALSELGFEGEEAAYSDEQFKLTAVAVPILESVVELLVNDNMEKANQVFVEEAIPAQNLVLEQLSRMLEYQQKAAQLSLKHANASYRSTIIKISLLALGAFIIGLTIALAVVKRASRAKDALFAQVALESIGDAVITTDAESNINYLNPIAELMTGWTFEQARGKAITDVFNVTEDGLADNDNHNIFDNINSDNSHNINSKAVLINLKGEAIAIDYSVRPIIEKDLTNIGNALAFRNVSKERELRRQLSFQACHDALTGLINRFEFEKRLEKLITSSKGNDKVHALLYLDLDEFKVVNDTCGHAAGDELLRQLSSLLHRQVRGRDTIARLGGDEFGILLENCEPGNSLKLATTILHAVQDFHFAWEGSTFKVGVSIGVVEINRHSNNIANVMATADTACYSAKDSGRNRVHIAEEHEMDIESRRGEMQWVSKIAQALEDNNFTLHYQAICSLKEPEQPSFGIEFLVRMINDNGELIPPGAFIPAAERYNLMSQLDRWVVTHAFEWMSKNTELTSSLTKCAINLSGQSIGDENFLSFIKSHISIYNLNPTKICFEITETAAISNLNKATEFITELKALGCVFSLDDFGSGLSSFAYLKNLPVEYIKIDGMFVRDIANDPIDKEMVRSITSIAKAMNKKTIAEFVENDEIKNILSEMGVDYVQGYGIAKPQPLDELTMDIINTKKIVSDGRISQPS